MDSNVEKLIYIAGHELGVSIHHDTHINNAIQAMLLRKNGFYAFEGALHVFPLGVSTHIIDIESWNTKSLWRFSYPRLPDDTVFFAEDVFGGQYGINGISVCKFDPETGGISHHSNSVECWAKTILGDYEYETGYTLCHEWQVAHGPMQLGTRLVPIVPFVLGGEFVVANLKIVNAASAMLQRAELAIQISDLPDGTSFEYHPK